MTIFDDLRAPLHPSKVSWRVGSVSKDKSKGMALAYLDWRDVMERLDEACGPNNWQSECFDAGDGRLAAKIGILLDGVWVWKCDGAGGRETSAGLSEMNANKGDFSDALKRAAVQWGIGRYLYDVPAPWVDLDEWKRIKPDQQHKLDRALGSAAPKTSDKPKPTAAERMIANRPDGKRYDSPSDSKLALQGHMTAMALATTQAELKDFCATNKREIDHLLDADWADLAIAIKKRMTELPEGVAQDNAA